MKFQKFTALLLAALLVLSLAACGTKDNDKMADMSGDSSAMTGEPKNAEEALALHKKLMEQENTILSQNTALWEKVFMEADKGLAQGGYPRKTGYETRSEERRVGKECRSRGSPYH